VCLLARTTHPTAASAQNADCAPEKSLFCHQARSSLSLLPPPPLWPCSSLHRHLPQHRPANRLDNPGLFQSVSQGLDGRSSYFFFAARGRSPRSPCPAFETVLATCADPPSAPRPRRRSPSAPSQRCDGERRRARQMNCASSGGRKFGAQKQEHERPPIVQSLSPASPERASASDDLRQDLRAKWSSARASAAVVETTADPPPERKRSAARPPRI
jgi:hypothetical protein